MRCSLQEQLTVDGCFVLVWKDTKSYRRTQINLSCSHGETLDYITAIVPVLKNDNELMTAHPYQRCRNTCANNTNERSLAHTQTHKIFRPLLIVNCSIVRKKSSDKLSLRGLSQLSEQVWDSLGLDRIPLVTFFPFRLYISRQRDWKRQGGRNAHSSPLLWVEGWIVTGNKETSQRRDDSHEIKVMCVPIQHGQSF